ncbi:hypothetical protein J8969_04845 [Klebsiella pneumoniae]
MSGSCRPGKAQPPPGNTTGTVPDYCPAALTAEQLTIAPGHVAINDLQTLKAEKYPDLAWRVESAVLCSPSLPDK